MKNRFCASRILIFVCLAIFANVFISCRKTLGFGVMLWDMPAENLRDGDIVKVFIKSNISSVYVIENPLTQKRLEVPLWQITEPISKKRARQIFALYSAYAHKYAYSKRDGLPIHADASNTSKNTYRLRQGEIVKILYEGKGQPVMVSATEELPGKWLYVLTTDGSIGWCYSYSLEIFESDGTLNASNAFFTSEKAVSIDSNNDGDVDEAFLEVAEKIWYPENFKKLIDDKTIDLTAINLNEYFKIKTGEKQIVLNSADAKGAWHYSTVKKNGNAYQLVDSPATVTIRNPNHIIVRVIKNGGRPEDLSFVSLVQTEQTDDGETTSQILIADIISIERNRRNLLLQNIFNVSEFSSTNYGTIYFDGDNVNGEKSFEWKNYNLLVPEIIPQRAGSKGTVDIKYILSKELASKYDGVLTFKFDNTTREVNFLYTLEQNGLRLEEANGATFEGEIVTRRSLSPLVLFFQK